MAYTTNQLISGAFYASGVVSREFETVSGPEIGDGLVWLNNIITENTVNDSMISYESTYNFNFVAGQEKYVIPDLIDVDTLVFYLNNVRFAMDKVNRDMYFGRARAENIQALPFMYYVEKQFEGADLYVYFLPNQAYAATIHGVFRMAPVALGQDLSATLDEFYTTYLRYCLAERICAEYNLTTPVNVTKQLGKYEEWISKKSKTLDLSLRKVSSLNQNRYGFDWSFANLYRGYVP